MSDRRQRLHPLARLAGLAVAVVVVFAAIALTGPLSGSRVRGWIGGGSDLRAGLVFVALYAGLTAACFPGPVLAGASGLLFGTLEGTLLSLTGAVLGAVISFTLSRYVAGDLVARTGGPRLRRLAAWVGRRGFRSVLYARIIPGAPYSVVNYAAGLAPLRLRDFAAATAVGAAPRTFAYTALGGSLHDLTSPAALIAVGVIVAMAVLGLALGMRERARAAAPPSPG
ncbi:MAG: TVP38/TMEM64 family protein [Solirubrobacteraceae bacterium]